MAGSYPKALSLGMQRRVALARALADGPRVLVLDEPFVSLDDAAAAGLRGLVVDTVDATGMSVLMVTHNVAEAIGIADRLLLVSRRPASLVADVPLDRPRSARDRAWADADPGGARRAAPGHHRTLRAPGAQLALASTSIRSSTAAGERAAPRSMKPMPAGSFARARTTSLPGFITN